LNHAVFFNVHCLGQRRPPGPYRIATILRNEGWDIEVIDFCNSWKLEELQELAKARITSKTKFVGFGVMFDMWNSPGHMETFSIWLKEKYPDVKQVLGGQYPPVHTATCIDYFITGYAEHAIIELVKVFAGSKQESEIKFDPLHKGTKKLINGNKDYPSFPMKDLMISYQDRDFIHQDEWLTIEFSRGCKFKCPYCTYPILGVKGDYSRDADDAYRQLQETYDKFGVTNYFVADETFNDRTAKIEKFAGAVKQLSFDPWFSGFIRADLLVSREEDWQPLLEMGFLGQFYGIETFNYKSAKAIKKGMHSDKLKDGLLRVKDYFKNNGRKLYRGNIAQIIGLPFETKETAASSLKWLEENWIGEAVTVVPLEIPTDPKVDILSEMSLNWEALGYEKLETDSPEFPEHHGIKNGHMNSNMFWKNKHMTYFEAMKMADNWKLQSEKNRILGVGSFALDFPMSRGMSLEQALEYRLPPTYSNTYDEHLMCVRDTIVVDYINRKLSL